MKTFAKYLAIGTLALASFFAKETKAQEANVTSWEEVGNMFSHQITGTDSVWNDFRSEEEKINRLEEYTSKYKWDHGSYQGWVCADHIAQMQIDGNGIENIEEFISYASTLGKADYYPSKNGEGKIPFYHVGTTHINGEKHGVGGVLVGEDPLNFDDWYFIDYATMKRVHPGDDAMDANNPVNIGLRAYVEDSYQPGRFFFGFMDNLVKFDLQNGEVTSVDYKDSINVVGENRKMPYVILDNPNDDKVHLSKLENIIVDAGGFSEHFKFTVKSLDSLGYNSIPEITTENTPLEPFVEYTYSDTVKLGVNSYSFDVTPKGTIESGGIVNSDSTRYNVFIDYTTDIAPFLEPTKYHLEQNFPNPFNPETTIQYSTKKLGDVQFDLYNIRAEKLETILEESVQPGKHRFNLDFKDKASGVYFLRMTKKGETPKFIKLNHIK